MNVLVILILASVMATCTATYPLNGIPIPWAKLRYQRQSYKAPVSMPLQVSPKIWPSNVSLRLGALLRILPFIEKIASSWNGARKDVQLTRGTIRGAKDFLQRQLRRGDIWRGYSRSVDGINKNGAKFKAGRTLDSRIDTNAVAQDKLKNFMNVKNFEMRPATSASVASVAGDGAIGTTGISRGGTWKDFSGTGVNNDRNAFQSQSIVSGWNAIKRPALDTYNNTQPEFQSLIQDNVGTSFIPYRHIPANSNSVTNVRGISPKINDIINFANNENNNNNINNINGAFGLNLNTFRSSVPERVSSTSNNIDISANNIQPTANSVKPFNAAAFRTVPFRPIPMHSTFSISNPFRFNLNALRMNAMDFNAAMREAQLSFADMRSNIQERNTDAFETRREFEIEGQETGTA